MTVMISEALQEKLDYIQHKKWWPVALLAEILGRPKGFIYRRIGKGEFEIYKDGEYPKKISSKSVINYFNDS